MLYVIFIRSISSLDSFLGFYSIKALGLVLNISSRVFYQVLEFYDSDVIFLFAFKI